VLHILTSILLVPSLCTIFNILLLVFYFLWSKSYMLYSILYLVSTISILYTMYILYICYVLDSKFYILYMLHILTSILLVPSLCTIFNILLLVFYFLCPKSYILYLVSTIFNIVYVHSIYMQGLRFYILHSICVTYFNCYTLSSESMYYIQYLTSGILSSMS